MSEFIKGWSRMIGCVTLVMACVLTAGWIKSITHSDSVTIIISETSFDMFQSVNGNISLWRFRNEMSYLPAGWKSAPRAPEHETSPASEARVFGLRTIGWEFFGFAVSKDPSVPFSRMYFVPYWLVVIPIALLSAHLLLRKPRPRKPPQSTNQPDEATVTHA